MAGKRQRWTRGAVVAVPLGDGFHTYAQMLDEPEYAFFDCRTREGLSASAAVAGPVLFRLWVMGSAHSTGRWPKIGTATVAAGLAKPVLRYNQDPLRPQDIRLTYDGCSGPLESVAECAGLECAAVWDHRVRSDSKSGVKGVRYNADSGTWGAYVYRHGHCYHVGTYYTQEQAQAAYEAELKKENPDLHRAPDRVDRPGSPGPVRPSNPDGPCLSERG